jgi:hypothetical protein
MVKQNQELGLYDEPLTLKRNETRRFKRSIKTTRDVD